LQCKEAVKVQLEKVSSILQYLSFETVESMLLSMKTLNIKQFQTEFLVLTMFHSHEFKSKIDKLEGFAFDNAFKASLNQ